MTETTIPSRFLVRGGAAANLTTVNEVLKAREFCIETDTGKFKCGDGATAWNSLLYVGDLSNLGDPNNDRIVFWDDTAGAFAYLAIGTNLTITGTTLDATGGGGGGISIGQALQLPTISSFL